MISGGRLLAAESFTTVVVEASLSGVYSDVSGDSSGGDRHVEDVFVILANGLKEEVGEQTNKKIKILIIAREIVHGARDFDTLLTLACSLINAPNAV